ncbi:MAG: sigma-70 family RNA polymerase sigma factor [Candidatus Pacebacteria bacterium]|nr:sigma-70 family RNA polymerase sigma factor [Candidatus Paceibacterota bacterium]
MPLNGKVKFLTREEEAELAERMHAGSTAALNRLVVAHIPLVRKLAHGYANNFVSYDDLVQIGLIKLTNKAKDFDPSRNTRFGTYMARKVRSAMQEAVRKGVSRVGRADHLMCTLNRMEHTTEDFERQNGRTPTDQELSEQLGVSLDQVREWQLAKAVNTVSLDSPVGEPGSESLGSFLPDDAISPEEALIAQEESKSARLRVDALLQNIDSHPEISERDKKIFWQYYRPNGRQLRHKDLGAAHGITSGRAQQVNQRIFTFLFQSAGVDMERMGSPRMKRVQEALREYLETVPS